MRHSVPRATDDENFPLQVRELLTLLEVDSQEAIARGAVLSAHAESPTNNPEALTNEGKGPRCIWERKRGLEISVLYAFDPMMFCWPAGFAALESRQRGRGCMSLAAV